MPTQYPHERYVRTAIVVMLSLAMLAAGSATLIHWFSPVRQPMDLIIPPIMWVVFAGLLVALIRQPRWLIGIARAALLTSGLALAAPTWFYIAQATSRHGVQLIEVFPPVAPLLVVLMVMVMVFLPTRQALGVALLAWAVIALPVVAYLFAHPAEMWTPRGKDLLMAYGPVSIMVVVLLPVQQGLTGKIKQLASERVRMEVMVNRDPLTHIYNRRLCEQVLQDILAARAAAGVIMFDMDRFKAINDTYGHPVGDRVLQVVARRCKEHLREDECISRWGGEEFLVVVPNVDASGVQQLAERLRLAIAQSSVEPVPQVSASFGVTVVQDGDQFAGVLQRVDAALYKAKQRGGNCVAMAQVAGTAQPGRNLEGTPLA